MDLIQNILFQNSQWKEESFKTFEFKRDIFEKVWKDLDTKIISLITGPRRVGKSVLLRQLVNELIIQKNVPAKQILFYEFLPNDKEDTIWNVFDYFNKEITDTRLPIYIFFDEIQYVANYESMIKNIYDNTNNCKIFITGSLSLTYKRKMQESLAGRFFSYKLFPLNFLEFIKLYKTSSLKLYNKAKSEKDTIKKTHLLTQLNADFREFLEKGRYPETYNLTSEQNRSYLTNIINQSLNHDAYSYFKIEKPIIINNLFDYIRQNNGGLISINKLSNQLGTSNKTVSVYLNILEQMGIIYLVYNSTNPLVKSQGSKKVYINSGFSLLDTKLDIQTAYGFAVESYILERLLERNEIVTFWRKRDKEIDFLIPKKNLAYEVKFRSKIVKNNIKLKNFDIETISMSGNLPACLF